MIYHDAKKLSDTAHYNNYISHPILSYPYIFISLSLSVCLSIDSILKYSIPSIYINAHHYHYYHLQSIVPQEERLHGISLLGQLVLGSGVLRATRGRSPAAFGDVLRLRALGEQRNGRTEKGVELACADNVMCIFIRIYIYIERVCVCL